jgi:light-regulated signal transduction histidine kinase (bacteriophytochrome)
MIGAMRDITERARYIDAIKDQNRKLNEIAWIQSHEVRAPLCRIMALTNMLCADDYLGSSKEELLKHLDFTVSELDDVIRKISEKAENLNRTSL